MPRYDFRSPRLYVTAPLAAGTRLTLDKAQANYLLNVLRLKPGAPVLVFNGSDGEWQATLAPGKRHAILDIAERTRDQTVPCDLHLLFAPLKHARLDYLVQKAVELGVSRLRPVLTQHTQAQRTNLERMRANAVEAAEQCGILTLARVDEPVRLDRLVAAWKPTRLLVFCDEHADVADPIKALSAARTPEILGPLPLSVLVGPEGGFSEAERTALVQLPNVVRLALGPRILRADTAAVAVLALVQAVLGDWR